MSADVEEVGSLIREDIKATVPFIWKLRMLDDACLLFIREDYAAVWMNIDPKTFWLN